MATKTPSKQSVEPIVENKPALNESVDAALNAIASGVDIEDMIADQLLDDIDWQKVRAAMLTKVKHRFFCMACQQQRYTRQSFPVSRTCSTP